MMNKTFMNINSFFAEPNSYDGFIVAFTPSGCQLETVYYFSLRFS